MSRHYDLVVIGAGSGGLVGATFAARLGARVALVEKNRIGGDCTWTGCVPSKALLKVARVAHELRRAGTYGLATSQPCTDMSQVAAYVRRAIADVYSYETPAALADKGIEFVAGSAEFVDDRSIRVGDTVLSARRFLICTGARAVIPPVPGLSDVPFLTYERFFENERLPAHLIVIGSGPIGLEMALAYRRLGAEVTVVGQRILPREDSDVRDFVADMLHRERIRLIDGTATGAAYRGGVVVVRAANQAVEGDLLLVAAGRRPYVAGLALERAGVGCTPAGIGVDAHLRTSVPHVYAAGDVVGDYQFTHYAGWQAFLAVRNALLPGRARAVTGVVPRVTFLDPEVAHVGLSELEAQRRYGLNVRARRFDLAQADRAITDGETAGFIKLVASGSGRILGATVVASHAGEIIAEFALAIQQRLKVGDIAGTIHPYPTWSTPVQLVAADMRTRQFLDSAVGRLACRLAGLRRT